MPQMTLHARPAPAWMIQQAARRALALKAIAAITARALATTDLTVLEHLDGLILYFTRDVRTTTSEIREMVEYAKRAGALDAATEAAIEAYIARRD